MKFAILCVEFFRLRLRVLAAADFTDCAKARHNFSPISFSFSRRLSAHDVEENSSACTQWLLQLPQIMQPRDHIVEPGIWVFTRWLLQSPANKRSRDQNEWWRRYWSSYGDCSREKPYLCKLHLPPANSRRPDDDGIAAAISDAPGANPYWKRH